jgi:hypothetical protein
MMALGIATLAISFPLAARTWPYHWMHLMR